MLEMRVSGSSCLRLRGCGARLGQIELARTPYCEPFIAQSAWGHA